MPAIIDQTHYLEVNNVPLALLGAWRLFEFQKVLSLFTRGENTLIPHADGRDPNPLRVDEAEFQLRIDAYPWRGYDGEPHDDPVDGVLTNMLYLSANVANPPDAPTATQDAVLHLGGLGNYTGDVQVPSLEWGEHDGYTVHGVLDLRLPAGLWTPAGS